MSFFLQKMILLQYTIGLIKMTTLLDDIATIVMLLYILALIIMIIEYVSNQFNSREEPVKIT